MDKRDCIAYCIACLIVGVIAGALLVESSHAKQGHNLQQTQQLSVPTQPPCTTTSNVPLMPPIAPGSTFKIKIDPDEKGATIEVVEPKQKNKKQ